jgi:hypothetical protein
MGQNREEVNKVPEQSIYKCQCAVCVLPETHPVQAIHHQMNVFLSRLDEQQRRWYVALEAQKLGHGGIEQMAQLSGMDVSTIRRGGRELANNLEDRPVDQIRLSGGGRPRTEKNNRQ